MTRFPSLYQPENYRPRAEREEKQAIATAERRRDEPTRRALEPIVKDNPILAEYALTTEAIVAKIKARIASERNK